MRILAFGASSSSKSINKRLASYAASLIDGAEVDLLDLNDFEMPIYSIDREQEGSLPNHAVRFKKHIQKADAIIISFAEHNGTYTAAYKNILDWATRVEKNMWMDKPMLLLSTSPGARGGQSILEIAVNSYAYLNGKVVGSLAVPSFNDTFLDDRLVDSDLDNQLKSLVNQLLQTIKEE